MNTSRNFKASLIIAALLSFSVAQAADLTKAEYKAAKAQISADYKADKDACDELKANAKDICVAQARAKSAYAVAKEKCDDQEDNAKDVCLKEAKAVETKTLADAKMSKQIGEAKKEASEDKSDANYKVAIEKCDAMTGDAKTSCVAAAKSKFGKN
jgi:membrane-associated HD superfamily phosphohydrolase